MAEEEAEGLPFFALFDLCSNFGNLVLMVFLLLIASVLISAAFEAASESSGLGGTLVRGVREECAAARWRRAPS